MTKNSHVLKMLNEIAAKDVELATEALARAMKAADDAQAKHDMLVEYRRGYLENMHRALATGMSAEAYQNFKNFLKKLEQAIAGQLEVTEIARQQVNVNRQLWQESQKKKLSYDVLIDRSDQRALKVEQKKDQKLTDEFATRISRTKRQ